jgi:hypothetical protein
MDCHDNARSSLDVTGLFIPQVHRVLICNDFPRVRVHFGIVFIVLIDHREVDDVAFAEII